MPIQGVAPRLLEIGRIRMGEKGSKGEPKRLEHWRLTSAHLDSLNAATKLWGGVVGEWEGGYELLTETDTLEVLVPPNAFTSYMEAWTAGGIQRRCDGLTELITGDECLCSADGNEICEPSSNLRVLLPQLPGIGSWRLSTKGWTAAAELQGTIELLQRTAHVGEWPAAELFLDQRAKVVAGQTRRFIVPVLRLPYSLAELGASNTRSLGSGAVVRVDTNTGEINPLESPSRETPVSTSGDSSSPSSTEAGDSSAPIRGRHGADGGAGSIVQSPDPPATSEGTTAARTTSGTRGATADPSDSSGGGKARRKKPSREPVTEPPSPAGAHRKYPLDPAICKHAVGIDLELRCVDCGAKMAEATP